MISYIAFIFIRYLTYPQQSFHYNLCMQKNMARPEISKQNIILFKQLIISCNSLNVR